MEESYIYQCSVGHYGKGNRVSGWLGFTFQARYQRRLREAKLGGGMVRRLGNGGKRGSGGSAYFFTEVGVVGKVESRWKMEGGLVWPCHQNFPNRGKLCLRTLSRSITRTYRDRLKGEHKVA